MLVNLFTVGNWSAASNEEISNELERSQSTQSIVSGSITGDYFKPVTLYTYLKARFGAPNGEAMFFRTDDVDNIIQWQWTLTSAPWTIRVTQLNDRIEFVVRGPQRIADEHWGQLFESIRADFKNVATSMAEVRKTFERWNLFANPAGRIKRVVDRAIGQLKSLAIEAPGLPPFDATNEDKRLFFAASQAYFDARYEAYFLCSTLKFHLPVLGEALINLLIAVLAKGEIAGDKRLLDSVLREEIDIRIKKLHLNCNGFKGPINVLDPRYKRFHSVMNSRNETLHGNLDMTRLGVGTMSFDFRTIPLFDDNVPLTIRLAEAELLRMSPTEVLAEFDAVTDFFQLTLEHLDQGLAQTLSILASQTILGRNCDDGRLGVIVPTSIGTMYGMSAEDGIPIETRSNV